MRIIFISDLLSDGCEAVDPESEDGEFLAKARARVVHGAHRHSASLR
jgi:hypothetical protein